MLQNKFTVQKWTYPETSRESLDFKKGWSTDEMWEELGQMNLP